MLERVGKWCFRRRRFVLAAWVALLVGFTVLGQVAGGTIIKTLRLPGTESQKAYDVFLERFPTRAGDVGRVVILSDAGVRGGETQPAVQRVLDRLALDVQHARLQEHMDGRAH